jgi:hypothetical protein
MDHNHKEAKISLRPRESHHGNDGKNIRACAENGVYESPSVSNRNKRPTARRLPPLSNLPTYTWPNPRNDMNPIMVAIVAAKLGSLKWSPPTVPCNLTGHVFSMIMERVLRYIGNKSLPIGKALTRELATAM